MELNKADGYWRVTLDLVDGKLDLVLLLELIECLLRYLSLSIQNRDKIMV